MYVFSEDGLTIDELPCFVVKNHLYGNKHLPDQKPFYISSKDGYMAKFDSEADAKARLADVVAWLNASSIKWMPPDWDVRLAELKPVVYDFGKPIGYWRQP